MRRVATSFSFSGGGCRPPLSHTTAVDRRRRESVTPTVIPVDYYEPIVFLHVDWKSELGCGLRVAGWRSKRWQPLRWPRIFHIFDLFRFCSHCWCFECKMWCSLEVVASNWSNKTALGITCGPSIQICIQVNFLFQTNKSSYHFADSDCSWFRKKKSFSFIRRKLVHCFSLKRDLNI